MKPLNNFILLELIPEESKTSSGILLGIHSEMSYLVREVYSNSGKVLAIGKDVKNISPGDEIYFGRWGVKKEGEFYFVREDDVLAKYERI